MRLGAGGGERRDGTAEGGASAWVASVWRWPWCRANLSGERDGPSVCTCVRVRVWVHLVVDCVCGSRRVDLHFLLSFRAILF